jgi:hypothetical protein
VAKGKNYLIMENLSRNIKARLAGILYLLLVISGFIYLVYIPLELIDMQNAAKTLENIQSSELLFRLGIATAICSSLIFMILPLALYNLLKEVNKTSAIFMVLFALISIPISFVNILNKFSVLTLINKPEYTQKLGQTELQTQVMLLLENYNNGVQLSQIFWGLWLLPFGYLVYKSGFLPKILGMFLMAGCFGYLITFFGSFLYSSFNNTILSDIVGFPAPIGEIGICLWLLIMGTNKLNFRKKPLIVE